MLPTYLVDKINNCLCIFKIIITYGNVLYVIPYHVSYANFCEKNNYSNVSKIFVYR